MNGDIFDQKDLAPMLIGKEGEAFDSPDYIYELKLDGVRGLAYLGDTAELRNKRNLRVSPLYPELSETHKQVTGHCILDGEFVVISEGKPNFSEMQRRALMSNRTKIQLAASLLPVSFVAFDILYLQGKQLTALPLMERKTILTETVRESARLSVSRYFEEGGSQLCALTEQQGLEGVVAKLRDSRYYFGKRTKEWIKIKNMQDDDFVVCGYIRKSGGVTSLVLGQYRAGELAYKGHVTLGVSVGSRILTAEQGSAPFQPPPGNERAVWLRPELVCTVKYMEKNERGSLRQPVFKGLRDDKSPASCIDRK